MHVDGDYRELGDDLVLRRATSADVERIAEFNAFVHGNRDTGEVRADTADATRDLMDGNHPTCTATDFTLVEDRRTGAIVSTLCLIPQTWTYAGLPLSVGRPELVGTHPAYRNRGLVRAQFELIHRWADAQDMALLAISGIPWFYRQFGYEMAVDLSAGQVGYRGMLPRLKEGEVEPFRIRPATGDDASFIAAVYTEGVRRWLMSCVRDAASFSYEIAARRPTSSEYFLHQIVEDDAGSPVGFFAHQTAVVRGQLAVIFFELRPGVSWSAATASVIRFVQRFAEEHAPRAGTEPWESYNFLLGRNHPAFQALPNAFVPLQRPYAWYVRVPDLPRFLRQIAPVLEQRLAGSIVAGYTGALRLVFYRSGLRLDFANGALITVERWQPTVDQLGDARFPDLTFLQLLFGHRSLDELEDAFPDCRAGRGDTSALLQVLFPKQASDIWALQ
jgi:hypothetical protein